MRLCTIRLDGAETAAVVTANGIVPVASINAHLGRAWPTEVLALIERGLSPILLRDAERTPHALPAAAVQYGPAVPPPTQDLGHRAQLPGSRGGSVGAFSHRAGVLHEGRPHHHRPRRHDRAASRVRARDRGGGAGRDHRPALPRRLRGGRRRGDRGLLPDHRHDRRGYPAAQPALSDALEELRHLLLVRAGAHHAGRGARRDAAATWAPGATARCTGRTSWPTWPSRRRIWWPSIRAS